MNKQTLENAKTEVSANFEYFKSKLPELTRTHPKKFVLLHHKQIISFFESENDAFNIGMRDYGEGCFSIQQVTDSRIELGYQSYVII